jgi:hypothetical protein
MKLTVETFSFWLLNDDLVLVSNWEGPKTCTISSYEFYTKMAGPVRYESVKTDPIPVAGGMKVFEIRPVWTGTCEYEHTNLQHWYKPVN